MGTSGGLALVTGILLMVFHQQELGAVCIGAGVLLLARALIRSVVSTMSRRARRLSREEKHELDRSIEQVEHLHGQAMQDGDFATGGAADELSLYLQGIRRRETPLLGTPLPPDETAWSAVVKRRMEAENAQTADQNGSEPPAT
jgi:hypothetical protein